jgi:hypothetical protein
MPDPLIPFEETDALTKIYSSNEEDDVTTMVSQFNAFLKRLPFLNSVLLRFLCQFLQQISVYSDVTKMTADNLAICFGPNLIRFRNASAAVAASQIESKVLSVLIKEYDTVFQGIGEVW